MKPMRIQDAIRILSPNADVKYQDFGGKYRAHEEACKIAVRIMKTAIPKPVRRENEIPYCCDCDTELQEDWEYCPNCGAKMDREE